jgi:hypothetical protein
VAASDAARTVVMHRQRHKLRPRLRCTYLSSCVVGGRPSVALKACPQDLPSPGNECLAALPRAVLDLYCGSGVAGLLLALRGGVAEVGSSCAMLGGMPCPQHDVARHILKKKGEGARSPSRPPLRIRSPSQTRQVATSALYVLLRMCSWCHLGNCVSRARAAALGKTCSWCRLRVAAAT